MIAFKINYHSFIDVITNSSSELFVSTDKTIINFFKEILKLDKIKADGSHLSILSIKEFKENYGEHTEMTENDNDLILVCDISSDSYDFIYEIMTAFKFKSIEL